MRSRSRTANNHERWLVSYADFITLLFAFFVVLFAASTVDEKKMRSFAAGFENYMDHSGEGDVSQLPGTLHSDLSVKEVQTSFEQLEADLWPEIESGKIELSKEPRGLVMSLSESALFPPGEASLQARSIPIMRKVGVSLSRLPGQIRLEGHTDDSPIRTRLYPSNWQLSTARATAVLKFLINERSMPSDRLSAAGYGEFRPLVPNDSPKNRAKNRRVDVVILR
jgi:chemotaxis protein MotB